MRNTCIPHTELPGTSALFADYLYRFDRVERFFEHDPRDADAVRRAARAVDLPDDRRQALTTALRAINGEAPGLALLELPETVAVVTGQQVGLFGGPAYTIYKALTAVKLARHLTESGIPAVPVFWLATEDHDWAEVDHAVVFGHDRRPVRLTARASHQPGGPVGPAVLTEVPLEGLKQALRGHLYADEVLGLAEECYQVGRTMGEAFRMLLERILAGWGLVFIDPMRAEVRTLAAPLLRAALERAGELSADLMARGRELISNGYHAQVLFEQDTSLFFLMDEGRRLSLRRLDGAYFHQTRRLETRALAERAEQLSPTALLRPVMQDYMLPTAAYVGGPAEIAYLAQSHVLYRALLHRAPVAVSRSGFTLVDERSRMLMERHHIALTECLHGEEMLKARIARSLVPEELQAQMEETALEVRALLDRLSGALHGFDPTLGAAMEKSKAKILYQIEKNRKKAAREAMRRDERIEAGARHLSGLVFPDRHLQERYYSILPFLAAHGLGLLDTIYENTQRACPDHLLLTV
jgi:bacillithiol biosynthesis cysteine-adding enzyme BshC